METISREFRVALPWELLYADDMVVIPETEQDIIKTINEWKDKVGHKGIGVNMNTSGYATWFTAGGAISIAHYDVIDDVITQKL